MRIRFFPVVVWLVAGGTSLGAQASLKGSVVSDGDERPIPNAEIIVIGLGRSARSDSVGAFELTGVASGAHQVLVRRAGFAPWSGSLTFHRGQTVEADFVLEPTVATLETVEVNATLRDLRLRDFDERRQMGFGRFITADVFERNAGREMSSILTGEVAGLRIYGDREKNVGTARDGGGMCLVQVVLNDIPVYRSAADGAYDINSLNPADVLGLEYYSVASTPTRFAGTGGVPEPVMSPELAERVAAAKGAMSPSMSRSMKTTRGGPSCGTLVIWTK